MFCCAFGAGRRRVVQERMSSEADSNLMEARMSVEAEPKLSVVVVDPHQDDEMNCLGTLLKCRERGDVVTMVAVSSGEKGGWYLNLPQEQVAEARRDEASRVAEGLGGEYVCLGAEDMFIQDTPELRMSLVRVLRRVAADVVITVPPNDYSLDHVTTSQVATQAALLSAVPTLKTDEPALRRPPALFFMDTITGLDSQPTVYVDITEQFERKCELLRLHDSQMVNLKNFAGFDLAEYADVVNRFRGLQVGVAYAEGFRPAMRNPLIRAGAILP